MAKIIIDEEKCIGCGSCEASCPEIFVVDEQSFKVKLKTEDILPEQIEKVKEAILNCPTQAIILSE
jgi:ferredoxin